MKSKRGFGLAWEVLIPLIVLAGLLVLYLIFSGIAGNSIGNAIEYIKNLFKFGG